LGGYNIAGARTYIYKTFNLPPHQLLKISLDLWYGDSWDAEYFQIQSDVGLLLNNSKPAPNSGNGDYTCGTNQGFF